MNFEFDFLIVGLMQVVGFFVQGSTGFGCTVIAASVTNGILGTAAGVPYGTVIVIPFMYYLATKERKNISWKDLGKILVLCAPGIMIGQKLFYHISPQTARISIGTMICVIAVMNIHKCIVKPLIIKEALEVEVEDTIARKVYRYGCLVLGGVVHGAFTIGGPLITVYTLEAVKDKAKFRNTMIALWSILNTWNAITQYRNNAFNPYVMSALVVGLPLAGIGFFLGMRFLEKINKEQFLRMVYLVLLFIGVNMLKSNIPWTPQLTKIIFGSVIAALMAYSFIVIKKKNLNKKQLIKA